MPASDLNAVKMLEEAYNTLTSVETTTGFMADNGEAFGAILAGVIIFVILALILIILVKKVRKRL